MRITSGLIVVAALAAGTVSAQAYENFIPLGAGYSTDVSALPDPNSDQQAVTVQSDIYETAIYNKQREEQIHNSYMNRFFSSSENSGADFSIDY
jgi:hypothetical protein